MNRPGFAKIFFNSASEERDHAFKIIGYLLMRGGLTKDISQLIRDPVCKYIYNMHVITFIGYFIICLFFILQQPLSEVWDDGLSALKEAIKLEAHVTRKIRDIATTCEEPGLEGSDFNDYHVSSILFMLHDIPIINIKQI